MDLGMRGKCSSDLSWSLLKRYSIDLGMLKVRVRYGGETEARAFNLCSTAENQLVPVKIFSFSILPDHVGQVYIIQNESGACCICLLGANW